MAAQLHVFRGGKKDTPPPQPPTSEIDIICALMRELYVYDPDQVYGMAVCVEDSLKDYRAGRTPLGKQLFDRL